MDLSLELHTMIFKELLVAWTRAAFSIDGSTARASYDDLQGTARDAWTHLVQD